MRCPRKIAPLFLIAGILHGAPHAVVAFSIEEDAGRARKGALAEQGVPVPPLTAEEVKHLAVVDESGRPAPASIAADGTDPNGRVRWVHLAVAVDLTPWQKRKFILMAGSAPAAQPALDVRQAGESILIAGPGYTAKFSGKSGMQLRMGGVEVLDGEVKCQIHPDARSIINAGGKTTVLAGFVPLGWKVDRLSAERSLVTLRGRYPKQAAYSSAAGQIDPKLGYDVEVRFQFSSLSPAIQFDWRLINRAGYKSWLERYAVILPVAKAAKVLEQDRTWLNLESSGQRWGVTVPFAEDFGTGTGARLETEGLAIGGLDLPPDGGLGGPVPEIHRLFHHGMSRTFEGVIVPGRDAREALALDLKLPPQYYSDLNILPERGDAVTTGEFASVIDRSARWLLQHQWRGTLWAGEWWREWDVARRQGTEETSNANQELGPLFHYFRTGDKRFLRSASLAAWYVFDIQHDKKLTGFGPMLHTRRHLLDELDWIHPRYQRAAGALLAAHVLGATRERNELIATVRHFSERIQDSNGVPHDWDEATKSRGRETGVDTTNFIEALIAAWQETGDKFFLDNARGYTRWALNKWNTRTEDSKWNWNLTRYVESGLLAICHAAEEYPGSVPEQKEFLAGTIAISRHTLQHPEYAFVPGTLGEGGLHYIFYHAVLDSQVSRLAHDPAMLQPLLKIIRSQAIRQNDEGAFPMDVGSLWGQYPTQIISSYDAKSVVAYFPVLSARLAATAHR